MEENDESFDWEDEVRRAMQNIDEENTTVTPPNETSFCCDYCNFKSHVRQEIEVHNIDAHTSIIFGEATSNSSDTSINCQRLQDPQKDDDTLKDDATTENMTEADPMNNSGKKGKQYNIQKENEKQRQETTIRKHFEDLTLVSSNDKDMDPIENNIEFVKSTNLLFHCQEHDCSGTFGARDLLQIHINYKHKGMSYFICPQCGFTPQDERFTNKYHSLVRHIKSVHIKSQRYKCKLCNYSMFQKYMIRNHLQQHHRVGVAPDIFQQLNNRKRNLGKQPQALSRPSLRYKTKKNIGTQMFYKCKSLKCNYFAYEPKIVKNHFKMEHLTKSVVFKHYYLRSNTVKGKSTFPGKTIDASTTQGGVFHKLKRKINRKTFYCNICKGCYSTKFLLTAHMVFHFKVRDKRNRKLKVKGQVINSNKSKSNHQNKKKQKQNESLNLSQEISEYELLRQRNIEERYRVLRQLGIQ